jgi:DNA mismatch repair protein MutS
MAGTERTDLDSQQCNGNVSSGSSFQSILFDSDQVDLRSGEPACFGDLLLDHVMAGIVGRDEYELRPFFCSPLGEAAGVGYRHAVFRDLEHRAVRAAVDRFAEAMRKVRGYLGLVDRQRYPLEKQRWFLDAATAYCALTRALHDELAQLQPGSAGFTAFGAYLADYCKSSQYRSLEDEARSVREGLSRVRYTVRIRGGRVTVRVYADEPDLSAEVEQIFARFRQGAVESHLVDVPDSGSMNHVEAQIAQLVSQLFPGEFSALEAFCARHAGFLDGVIARFDREVQFYLAYLDYIGRLDAAFCYPTLVEDWGHTSVEQGFDLALAAKEAASGVIRNDFTLRGAERVLVVTGPNQGGKTTFARMVGQLHYLAALGVPVPAASARLVLPDAVFSVFGRREDIATLRGRLDDELVRVKQVVDHATDRSLILLNEVFASTTLHDAVFLGREVMGLVIGLGAAAVWVTFIDELASVGEETVSMVALVDPNDPSVRTFKLVRRPADGRAYALAIAEKYDLSYQQLRARISR